MNELIKVQIKKNAITKEEIYNYNVFIIHALLGLSPTGADLFYKKHETSIDKVAKCYRECWSYPKDNLYRGIILEDSAQGVTWRRT